MNRMNIVLNHISIKQKEIYHIVKKCNLINNIIMKNKSYWYSYIGLLFIEILCELDDDHFAWYNRLGYKDYL